jgi:hypothetical protein
MIKHKLSSYLSKQLVKLEGYIFTTEVVSQFKKSKRNERRNKKNNKKRGKKKTKNDESVDEDDDDGGSGNDEKDDDVDCDDLDEIEDQGDSRGGKKRRKSERQGRNDDTEQGELLMDEPLNEGQLLKLCREKDEIRKLFIFMFASSLFHTFICLLPENTMDRNFIWTNPCGSSKVYFSRASIDVLNVVLESSFNLCHMSVIVGDLNLYLDVCKAIKLSVPLLKDIKSLTLLQPMGLKDG